MPKCTIRARSFALAQFSLNNNKITAPPSHMFDFNVHLVLTYKHLSDNCYFNIHSVVIPEDKYDSFVCNIITHAGVVVWILTLSIKLYFCFGTHSVFVCWRRQFLLINRRNARIDAGNKNGITQQWSAPISTSTLFTFDNDFYFDI